MFTGIIEAKAEVLSLKKIKNRYRLVLRVPIFFSKIRLGSSVSVNGACLTVFSVGRGKLLFDILDETMKRTNFRNLSSGSDLNLERALRWNERIEGHFVQGHVDGTGKVLKVLSKSKEKSFQISFPNFLQRYFIEKGSVAVNGVSLTLGKIETNAFWVHVIPMTLKKTNLEKLEKEDLVNLEADILLKTVSQLFR